jgi:hypothetical protein
MTTSRESWDGSFDMPQAQQPTRRISCISRGLNASESYEEYDELVAAFIRDANPPRHHRANLRHRRRQPDIGDSSVPPAKGEDSDSIVSR